MPCAPRQQTNVLAAVVHRVTTFFFKFDLTTYYFTIEFVADLKITIGKPFAIHRQYPQPTKLNIICGTGY